MVKEEKWYGILLEQDCILWHLDFRFFFVAFFHFSWMEDFRSQLTWVKLISYGFRYKWWWAWLNVEAMDHKDVWMRIMCMKKEEKSKQSPLNMLFIANNVSKPSFLFIFCGFIRLVWKLIVFQRRELQRCCWWLIELRLKPVDDAWASLRKFADFRIVRVYFVFRETLRPFVYIVSWVGFYFLVPNMVFSKILALSQKASISHKTF